MKGIPTPGCPCELCERARRCDSIAAKRYSHADSMPELEIGIETFSALRDLQRVQLYRAALSRLKFAHAMSAQTIAALKCGQSVEHVVAEVGQILNGGTKQ